ncbi:alpha/beta-hydrolase [Coniochaeta ligniaria NRRL 30616]|uniref:Alpha/beta-hydrolase n=1 Tax=Coniochaeta ligniaria NRRL 30616 TaxID=1408157 RepID=A0A1J7J660_9PEZI|nr:alpha/beta-hydrolase [Coniochaeta ligniaria NRRL 30616]
MAIQPARLLSRRQHVLPGMLHINEVFFEVPKNYAAPKAGTLKLFGRVVNRSEIPAVVPRLQPEFVSKKPFLVYLEGGPGMGNQPPQDVPLTKHFLDRGYQLLYLDYRGTGLSTPINAKHVTSLGDAAAQADYLKLFRQDNIVRDLEAVRLCLTEHSPRDRKQWSIIGQSFGGFVSLTYLSKYPQSLRESFITGGLAPIGKTPEAVYEATFKKVIERNQVYYQKFPEDVERVWQTISHISNSTDGAIRLPGGGLLTVERFLSIGIAFGMHGGLNAIHSQVLKMAADLDQFNFFTRSTLTGFEQNLGFDVAPIYALLHEAIYCDKPGVASNWAAARVGGKLKEFSWLAEPGKTEFTQPRAGEPVFFTGEMVFPFHFDTFPELVELKDAAGLLAKYDEWEELYDEDALRKNEVPVYAASFVEDMYVDFDLARETARKVKGIRVYETNGLYHNAVRARSEEVLAELCRLRDDPKD